MTDLRTGLVEAMAAGLVAHAADRDLLVLLSGNVAHRLAEGALDYGLGFLTDNADEWRTVLYDHNWIDGETGSISGLLQEFLAALSDSRDTGEKP